jgi:hypothetical protein
MITQIEVTNSLGNVMTLDFTDASSGIYVKDADGLGPVKASIVTSPLGTMDGVQRQSSRREARNIVFKIGLMPDFVTTTPYSLRSQLYDYFTTEEFVHMVVHSDGPLVYIDGQVESCEPDIFSQEPGMVISVICFEPDFISPTTTSVAGSTVSDTTESAIAYPGSARAGILFTLNVNRSISAFTIYNRQPDNTIQAFDFTAALISGDILTVDTRPGNRKATRTRAGVGTSVLYGVSPQAKWTELVKGVNNLRVYATGAAIPYQIDYTSRYGGL